MAGQRWPRPVHSRPEMPRTRRASGRNSAKSRRKIRAMWQDVRYSLRMLRRSPGFSLMAVAILSLGIGASTAAFSIVNSVFFRTVAVPEPGRLVYIYGVQENGRRYPGYGENYVNAFEGRFDKAFSGITAHQR